MVRRIARITVAVAAFLAGAPAGNAEDFKFDPSEYEKPAFQIGGYIEGKAEYFRYDTDSAFYRLNATEQPLGNDNDRETGTAQVRASYEKGPVTASFTLSGNIQRDADQGNTDDLKLLEGGAALRPATGLSIAAGKRVLKWGKGYGWNPVGFVERPKDPTDPDLSREGFWMVTTDFVRTFDGPLRTIGATLVMLPVASDLNEDFGKEARMNVGGKLYALYADTDIDLTFLADGMRNGGNGVAVIPREQLVDRHAEDGLVGQGRLQAWWSRCAFVP